MFKKLLAVMISAAVAVTFVGCGCGSDSAKDDGKLKLAKYKGVVVYHDDINVKDDEVKSSIDNIMSQSAEEKKVKKGKVGESDKVNVDYKGKIDYKGKKEAFEGGTAKSQDIDLAQDASKYIEGFTKSLVGHKVGDKFTAKMQFPKDYNNEATVKGKKVSLAGKPVWFTFKINKLTKKQVPKLTDSYAKKNAKKLFQATDDDKVKDVKSLKKYVKREMRKYNIIGKIWQKIIDDTKVVKYDDKELEEEKKTLEKNKLDQYRQSYQMTDLSLDDYLKACQMSKKDWNKQLTKEAKESLKQKMVIKQIAKDEGIKVTPKYYKTSAGRIATAQGTTIKELEKNAGKKEIEMNALYELVQDFVVDHVKEKKGSEPTTTPAPVTTKKAKKEKKAKK